METPAGQLSSNLDVKPLIIMTKLPVLITLLVAGLLAPRLCCAGTLDDAPFRIVVPSGDWQVADSAAQPMGKDVSIVATISNTNLLLKSVVIMAASVKDSGLDDLCAGIRDSFSNPVVKKVSEADTKFLGYRARVFTYLVTQGSQTTYNQATVFVANGKGWTIACVGRPEQQDEIKKMAEFFQKRAGL